MHERLPNSICEDCENNINKLYNFRKVIQKSDAELKNRLHVLLNTELAIPNLTEQHIKIEHDIKIEFHDDFIDFVKNENDKSITPQQQPIENTPRDLFSDINETINKSRERETLASLLAENAPELHRKYDSVQTNKLTILHKRYCCEKCDFTCEGHEEWKSHQRSCVGITCNTCGKAVTQENSSQHMQIHGFDKNTCSNTDDNLRIYEQERHNCVKLPCEVCLKKLPDQAALKQHIKLLCEYL